MVDLPEAERPVNQRVKPCWLRRALRSCVVTADACHVMLLDGREQDRGAYYRDMGRRTYVAIVVGILGYLEVHWEERDCGRRLAVISSMAQRRPIA